MGGTLSKVALINWGIQWSAFVLAAALHTETFYDFTGASTFTILAYYTFSKSKQFPRQIAVTTMNLIWALRLGTFLTTRMMR